MCSLKYSYFGNESIVMRPPDKMTVINTKLWIDC